MWINSLLSETNTAVYYQYNEFACKNTNSLWNLSNESLQEKTWAFEGIMMSNSYFTYLIHVYIFYISDSCISLQMLLW
jgi:hypothetical protein